MSIFKFIKAVFRTIKAGVRMKNRGIEEVNNKLLVGIEYTDNLNLRAEAWLEKNNADLQKAEERYAAKIKENPEYWGIDTTKDIDEQIRKRIKNLYS